MVDETTLEVPPAEGEDLPEEKPEVENLIQKIPLDEGEDKLQIADDEFKIIKEKFLHLAWPGSAVQYSDAKRKF